MRTPSMTKPRRRLYMAGRIAPKSRPCLYGHVGPFTPRPDVTEWLTRSLPDLVISEQVDCDSCGSTIGQEAPR